MGERNKLTKRQLKESPAPEKGGAETRLLCAYE
jgi:hypothetical protein